MRTKEDRCTPAPWVPAVLVLSLAAAAAPAAGERPPLDISLLRPLPTSDANGAFALRVGELFAAPEMAPVAETINDFLARRMKGMLPLNLPIRVQDIEQISGRVFMQLNDQPPLAGAATVSLTSIRMKRAFDWARLVKTERPDAREARYGGVTYFEFDWKPPGPRLDARAVPCSVYPVDDRTVFVESGTPVKELIDARKKPLPKPEWAAPWQEVDAGVAAIVFQDPTHRYRDHLEKALGVPGISPEDRARGEREAPFFRHASWAVAGVDLRAGCRLQVRFGCPTAEDGVAVEKACQALVRELRATVATLPDPGAEGPSPGQKAAMRLLRELTVRAAVRRTGKQVVVTVESKQRLAEVLPLLREMGCGEKASPPADRREPSRGKPSG